MTRGFELMYHSTMITAPHINDYDVGPVGPLNVDLVPTTVLAHAIDHVLRTSDGDDGSTDAYCALDNALKSLSPRSVCAWCGRVLREGSLSASHGICAVCFDAAITPTEGA